ncbi:MAG: lytic transglycosylase [Gammaproteobacteria bacterium]|nr:MAG: lytic transglycosylase [Gammaproteobacteria bacterium]
MKANLPLSPQVDWICTEILCHDGRGLTCDSAKPVSSGRSVSGTLLVNALVVLALLMPFTVRADTTFQQMNADGSVTYSDVPMADGELLRTSYRTRALRKHTGADCGNNTETLMDQRARHWLPAMRTAGERNGLDPLLLLAMARVESCFDHKAVSRAGAQGLMQLMPGTAREMNVSDSFDASDNISGGSAYLARMLAEHNDDLELALAAYNAGPGNVRKHGGVPPFPETRRYIKRVLAVRKRYADLALLD